MKIALGTLMKVAVLSTCAVAAQLRGGGSASGSAEAQESQVMDLASPPHANLEAADPDSRRRDLAVQRADRKPYFVQGWGGCSGALVAPDVVLTSASCKDGFFGPGAPSSAIVGSTRLGELTDGSERLHIVANSSVTHPSYDPKTFNADLMLFKIQEAALNAPIKLSPSLTIFLDEPNPQPTWGQKLATLGFGRVTPTGGVAGTALVGVDLLPVWDDSLTECPAWITKSGRSPRGAMCGSSTSNDEYDVCQASAGAPVVDWNGELVGIKSWDDGCLVEMQYGMATMVSSRVDVHLPWITSAICSLSDHRRKDCPVEDDPMETAPPPPTDPPRGGWEDGELCGLGTTCNSCKNPATYWYGEAMTACGTEPCWPRRTICGAGTTCNQCCRGYSWKLEDFFTSCN